MTNGGSSVGRAPGQISLEVGGSSPSPRTHARRRFQFRWGQRLGREECPYVRRWVADTPWFSARIHHFYRSDDARAFHDHPWWFVTVVLKGGYDDVSPCPACDGKGIAGGKVTFVDCTRCDGSGKQVDRLRVGSVRFRRALHRHTVQVHPGGVWTAVFTGPLVRRWGFWVKGKFKKSNKYFLEHGHHPCDQP